MPVPAHPPMQNPEKHPEPVAGPGRRPQTVTLEHAGKGALQQYSIALAIAVTSTAAAMAARLLFLPQLETSFAYMTFFPAVILTAFLGGYRSGVMTTLLSIALVFFLLIEPVGQIVFPDLPNLMEGLVFLVSGLLVAAAANATHKAKTQSTWAETEVARLAEQELTTRLLREQEERLANVIEGTEAAIWDWNVQTGEVVFNERWGEMLGYTLADLTPISIRTWMEFAHPEDLRRSDEQLAEVFAGRRLVYDMECRMRHRNGHWIWVHDRGKVVEWTTEGKALRMTGSHTDITRRKEYEEQLCTINKELQVLLDTIPTGIVKVVDRRLAWSNRAVQRILQYTSAEMLLQSTNIFYPSHEEYEALGWEAYPVLALGTTYETEQILVRKDGSHLLSRCKGCAIDPVNPALGSIWTMEDITENKKAEQAVQERSELFETLFTHSQMVQLLIDPHDGMVIDANSSAIRFYGYPLEQLQSLGLGDIALLAPKEHHPVIKHAQEGWTAPMDMRHRLASGQIRDVEMFTTLITIGGCSLLHAIIHDVTKRKRMEETLHQRDATLTAIIENQPGLVWLKDLNGRFLAVNTLFTRACGRNRPEEVVGQTDLDIWPVELANAYMADDQRVLQTGKPLAVEELIQVQDQPKWFETFKMPVVDGQGKVTGTTGFARDITERKLTGEALQRARDETLAAAVSKNDLLTMVAHEFRTPLSLLQTSLDILDKYGQRLSKAKRNQQQQHIRSATKQLINLANTILTYQRMDSDVAQNTPGPCDIGTLCRQITEEARVSWGQEHRFEMTMPHDEHVLPVDAVLFRHVLENLLVNAFKFTPAGRTVSLDVRRDADRLRVTVADQGIGMDEEDQAHVFEPHYRGRNAGRRRGMGLGLHIVREGVHRMGGTVSMTSTVGQGTTMIVNLPWRDAEPGGEGDADNTSPPLPPVPQP